MFIKLSHLLRSTINVSIPKIGRLKIYKSILSVIAIASCVFASTAFAINHDETFPRMLEMVTSASPAELEGIKDNFCKGQLAATMTAADIRGRAAELANEELT